MPVKSNTHQMGLFDKLPKAIAPEKTDRCETFAPCIRCAEQYLSDREVAARFGISKATVWRWHDHNPDFPRRIKLSPGTSRWKLSELVRFETKMQTADERGELVQIRGGSR